MAEETKNAQGGSTDPEETPDVLEQLEELRKNSVSREEYDRIKKMNDKLFKTVVERGTIEQDQKATEPVKSLDELRKAAFKPGQTNLEYMKNSLELRKGLMAAGEPDPYLPHSTRKAITLEDRDAVNRFVSCVEHCIEFAEGDTEVFTNELMRITKDASPQFSRR